jgi:hypothetical protein
MTIEVGAFGAAAMAASSPTTQARALERNSARLCRLVARLFAGAGAPLRARLLGCLMRPLGPLGVAGVAAGAFAVFLHPRRGIELGLDAVTRVSGRQVHELARFVEQVDPQALHHFAGLIANSPAGLAALAVPTLALLYRELQPYKIHGR